MSTPSSGENYIIQALDTTYGNNPSGSDFHKAQKALAQFQNTCSPPQIEKVLQKVSQPRIEAKIHFVISCFQSFILRSWKTLEPPKKTATFTLLLKYSEKPMKFSIMNKLVDCMTSIITISGPSGLKFVLSSVNTHYNTTIPFRLALYRTISLLLFRDFHMLKITRDQHSLLLTEFQSFQDDGFQKCISILQNKNSPHCGPALQAIAAFFSGGSFVKKAFENDSWFTSLLPFMSDWKYFDEVLDILTAIYNSPKVPRKFLIYLYEKFSLPPGRNELEYKALISGMTFCSTAWITNFSGYLALSNRSTNYRIFFDNIAKWSQHPSLIVKKRIVSVCITIFSVRTRDSLIQFHKSHSPEFLGRLLKGLDFALPTPEQLQNPKTKEHMFCRKDFSTYESLSSFHHRFQTSSSFCILRIVKCIPTNILNKVIPSFSSPHVVGSVARGVSSICKPFYARFVDPSVKTLEDKRRVAAQQQKLVRPLLMHFDSFFTKIFTTPNPQLVTLDQISALRRMFSTLSFFPTSVQQKRTIQCVQWTLSLCKRYLIPSIELDKTQQTQLISSIELLSHLLSIYRPPFYALSAVVQPPQKDPQFLEKLFSMILPAFQFLSSQSFIKARGMTAIFPAFTKALLHVAPDERVEELFSSVKFWTSPNPSSTQVAYAMHLFVTTLSNGRKLPFISKATRAAVIHITQLLKVSSRSDKNQPSLKIHFKFLRLLFVRHSEDAVKIMNSIPEFENLFSLAKKLNLYNLESYFGLFLPIVFSVVSGQENSKIMFCLFNSASTMINGWTKYFLFLINNKPQNEAEIARIAEETQLLIAFFRPAARFIARLLQYIPKIKNSADQSRALQSCAECFSDLLRISDTKVTLSIVWNLKQNFFSSTNISHIENSDLFMKSVVEALFVPLGRTSHSSILPSMSSFLAACYHHKPDLMRHVFLKSGTVPSDFVERFEQPFLMEKSISHRNELMLKVLHMMKVVGTEFGTARRFGARDKRKLAELEQKGLFSKRKPRFEVNDQSSSDDEDIDSFIPFLFSRML